MEVKVLSCFDGMACGMLAMQRAGIEVDRYVAYEIDKYAIKAATHNFPMIEEMGDVFNADFTQYHGFDFLIGGSPCTYWSIAQKNNRETEASGLGWELFSQYVRALHEAKPKYFIYENNKSMAKAIRDSIRETFGFEEICINSARVSAQNRQRYYWVGKRNEDGTYSKVNVDQPVDRGILLKDVLDGAISWQDKSYAYTTRCSSAIPEDTIVKHRHTMVSEPVRIGTYPNESKNQNFDSKQYRIYDTDGKSTTLCGQGGGMGAKTGLYAVPVCVAQRGRYNENGIVEQRFEARPDEKTSTLTTVSKDNMIAEPINTTADGKAGTLRATCYKDGIRNIAGNDVDRKTGIAEPVNPYKDKSKVLTASYYKYAPSDSFKKANPRMGIAAETVAKAIPEIAEKYGYIPEMFNAYNKTKITDKAPTLSTGSMVTRSCAVNKFENIYCYALPCEYDENGIPTKAISGADGKTYTVYQVLNGKITIKDKTYPIKLVDGYWIIRKLTVSECKRLQTVPEWYDFSCISNTQAYKCLGNGWTVDVIAHLIESCVKPT